MSLPPLHWTKRSFDELSLQELYDILKLRAEVFVVEQDCVYLDVDGKDQDCWHLSAYQEDELVAYARLVPPGLHYPTPAIGRVITAQTVRRTGVGRLLMEKAMQYGEELFGEQSVFTIEAQTYLEAFYTSLGFKKVSKPYLLDGIPHIEMVRKPEEER